MAKVYITAASRWAAMYFKEILKIHGHLIMSDWHNQPLTRTKDLSNDYKELIANDSATQIKASDVLLTISDFDNVPGGKHVDTGIALASGVKVILVGQYENIKQYHSGLVRVDDLAGVLKELGP